MESCYKKISKIRNVSFIFQNIDTQTFKCKKKIANIYTVSEKATNLFKKKILPVY